MTDNPASGRRRGRWILPLVVVATAVITFGLTALLTNIFEKKTEAHETYTQVVALDEKTVDPAVWGQNFPAQYDGYKKTADFTPTDHSTALVPHTAPSNNPDDPRKETTASKLEEDPRLVTMWTGYAFAKDYRHLRGHEHMLEDQKWTLRVVVKEQPGACLNCHSSIGEVTDELGKGDQAAGWAAMNKMPFKEAVQHAKDPITCSDCHDPKTMKLRITRPAFVEGIKELKASQGVADYDVNRDATDNEMRSFVCAQCHVEYYFKGEGKTLTFPWDKGTDINDVWDYYTEEGFTDFEHKITGAKIVKAQHPEFETWSAGVHAANGVSCADCHMQYQRDGAKKISNHDIKTPLTDINGTCGTCHKADEKTIKNRVTTIQNRFIDSRDRALDALTALIGDIEAAQKAGTSTPEALALAKEYQNKASFYVDYAYSENSYGFHAPDYMQRILSQSLDAARKGQLALTGMAKDKLEASTVATDNAAKAKEEGLY